jgi:hypothetical protein
MQPAILLVLCVNSCKTGMSVFCHGQRIARISIPVILLDRRVRARAIPPPEMSRNLQVPWWKSWVTSHSKNLQIWCRPWGGDAMQYLIQLVATPDTDYYLWFWPLHLCSGTHCSISVSHMSVELVQFVCCWILLYSYKYLHMLNLLKINEVDSERTFLFLSLHINN